MKFYFTLILASLILNVFAQNQVSTITGQVIDERSGIPVEGAEITLYGKDGTEQVFVTDSAGEFMIRLGVPVDHKLIIKARKYLTQSADIPQTLKKDTSLIVFMAPLEQGDFLPEFTFQKGSWNTVDTALFEAWGLDDYKDSLTRIRVVGYCSPDEPDSLAKLRGREVIHQFVSRGAGANSFVLVPRPKNFPQLYYDVKVKVKGKDLSLRKETALSEEYLNGVSSEEREAIYSFMRRVQLEFERW